MMFIKTISRALIQYQMASYQYVKSHWGDKTILQLSHVHNGISYTGILHFHIESACEYLYKMPWNRHVVS